MDRNDTALYRDAPLFTRLMQRGRPLISRMSAVVEHVPIGSTVFDIGCGSGLFGLHLKRNGIAQSVIGVDPSRSAIEVARNAARRLPASEAGQVSFVPGGSVADWPDSQFDVVSLIDVMHHVPLQDRQGLVEAAARRVRRGGRLIYKDMRRRPRWRALMNRLHDLVLARQWISYCPPEDIERWAVSSGLSKTHHEQFDVLWYAHELMVFSR